MQVFLQIVAFSLQTDGSGQSVPTKGKCPKNQIWLLKKVIFIWFLTKDFSYK